MRSLPLPLAVLALGAACSSPAPKPSEPRPAAVASVASDASPDAAFEGRAKALALRYRKAFDEVEAHLAKSFDLAPLEAVAPHGPAWLTKDTLTLTTPPGGETPHPAQTVVDAWVGGVATARVVVADQRLEVWDYRHPEGATQRGPGVLVLRVIEDEYPARPPVDNAGGHHVLHHLTSAGVFLEDAAVAKLLESP